eukprot:TRINITY_DN2248_c0_g1_i4.p1 TRINITY_DN2248_c0_g1~~TRINITY_DN2248_c0_g1_i4.p1  ORF type:complete len:550 (-),score=109.48 TRINITY_DN2248_c0_g1_i4:59-1708(-)
MADKNPYVLRESEEEGASAESLSTGVSSEGEGSPTTSEPDLTTMEDDKLDAFLNQLKETEDRLENELKELQEQYPTGMTLTPSSGSTPTPSAGKPAGSSKGGSRAKKSPTSTSSEEEELSTTPRTDPSTSKGPSDIQAGSSSIEPGELPQGPIIVAAAPLPYSGPSTRSGELEVSSTSATSEEDSKSDGEEEWTITPTPETEPSYSSSNTRYIIVRSEEYDPATEERPAPIWDGRTNKDSLYIDPYGIFWFIWSCLALLFALYQIQSVCIQTAFGAEASTTGIIIVDYLVDVFFIIDVILLFMVAYVSKTYYIITDSGRRMKRYLSTWFVIDFIAAFPWDVIAWGATDSIEIRNYVRFFKLLWIFRLYRALHDLFKKIRDIFDLINPALERIVGVVLFYFIMITLFACFWLIYGRLEGFGSSLFAPPAYLLALPRAHRYFYALWWSLYSFVDPSSLRHSPVTTKEIWFSFVMAALSLALWALIITSAIAFILHLDRFRRRWEASRDRMNFYLRRKDWYQNLIDGLRRVPLLAAIESKRIFSALARKMKV